MKQKEILLFGASGQIGRNLIRKLTKNNYKVTAVTRNIHRAGYILKTQANPGYLNLVEMNPIKYPYFLESSSRGNLLNRYSIVFYKPKVLLVKNSVDIHFLNEFDKLWDKNKVEQDEMVYQLSLIHI